MSTKFLFPDWENEDDDSQDLCGRMREMAEEAARRERQGLPEKKEPETTPQPYPNAPDKNDQPGDTQEPEKGERTFKTITISGKVDVANYNQVFTSFIYPLMKNNVEVTITIKGKSTGSAPLTENSQQYKITKESASQLGLRFEEEE